MKLPILSKHKINKSTQKGQVNSTMYFLKMFDQTDTLYMTRKHGGIAISRNLSPKSRFVNIQSSNLQHRQITADSRE